MDVPHQLQTLLQFLVTDASSSAHLPYILDNLSPACLAPSPHLQKWVIRVTSLMHSKDPAARWAAICIAYRMSFLSKSLLTDNAQSWVGIVFPSLSKPEPVPILRVSMRYLSLVLCIAGYNPEFQRQIAIPIVPKVSAALLTIAEKHNDQDIKCLSIQTLAQLVPLYPSLHKAHSQKLFGLCNQILGSPIHQTMNNLLDAAVKLYTVLNFLGGKVGGTNLWRNCLDEVLQSSWSAWLSLRTTFPSSAQLSHKIIGCLRSPDGKPFNPVLHIDISAVTPFTEVTLNFDKLKSGVSAICALLSAPISRPVRLPIGHLAAFCLCLLASTDEDEEQTHFDPHVKAAESSVIAQIWVQACRLLSCLAETTQGLLAPHMSRLIMIISSHTENNPDQPQKRSFLRCAYRLLYSCPVVGATLGINRLLKATIVILSPLYLQQSRAGTDSGTTSLPRGSKKRRREYEVDDVLSVANMTVCATIQECETLVAALDVVDQCMLSVELAPSTRSLANRVLLSILLSLPSIAPSTLSSDPSFHGKVIKKVRDICLESAQGNPHAMSKSTSLVCRSFSSENLTAHDKLHSYVDLLLHPRRPPFIRTLPFVESLPLSSAEESAGETVARDSVNLAFGGGENCPTTLERQNYPNPASQSSLALDPQAPIGPPQERASSTSIELRFQNIKGADSLSPEAAAIPTLPTVLPSQATHEILTGLTSSISEKGPPSTGYVAPMTVNESDYEEVPTIDLDSDSDA